MRGFVAVLVLAMLAGCSKSEADSREPPAAASKASPTELKLTEAARKFIVVEPAAPSGAVGSVAYFGRTAFRPKALSAIGTPLAGRIASVAVEPGRRVAAGALLFTVDSADALGVRTAHEQAKIKVGSPGTELEFAL